MIHRPVRACICAVSMAVLVLSSTALQAADASGFIPLFNGKDLTGWRPTGKAAAWSVHGGMIECNGEGGGWLLTEKQYEDYVLKLQYKVSPGCNSGVAIRCKPRKPGFSGMELQILDDFGGAPSIHSCMAVYSSIAPTKNMNRPAGRWNDVEVTCRGRRLRVVWNGEVVHDVDLDTHRELTDRVPCGHIGVQDHGNYVWFRNIAIRPLDAEDGWQPLLGSDIKAWKQIGQGKWDYAYGVLTATGKLGVLKSPASYKDFALKLQSRVSKGGNGGLFLRLPPGSSLEPKPWEAGYEIQMQDDYGKPPSNVSTGSVILIAAPKANLVRKPDVWNDYEITCRGETITVKMNGQLVTEARSKRSLAGHIGFESEVNRIQYRHAKIKPLKN